MAGWSTTRLSFPEAILASALIAIAMLVTLVCMGGLRSNENSANKRTKEDLRWREMADHGLREKV
jgi:hypothetical protein